MSSVESDPVFVHGILHRSGTNFLFQLLRLHPDLAPGRDRVYEDGFLTHSDDLFQFVETVRSHWDPSWELPEDTGDELLRHLGDGLLSFLTEDRERRLLVKNPRVRHLGRFFSLFPTARLIVLLRDGRSVVHSGMASFGWDLAVGARWWAEAADEVADFLGTSRGRAGCLLVHYEELVADLRPQVERILDFAGLDRAAFDFEQAERLPVHGSSEFFGPNGASVQWRPVARDETFEPRYRWRDWSREMHDEFWAIAGAQMRRLGYTQDAPPAAAG